MHEYKRLVEAAANIDPRIHLLVLLGGSAGLRRGEIMSLKWTDLDIKRRSIHVLYTDDGDALTNKIVRVWFERAQGAAGLEVTGAIHRLRHTFCSMLASEGGSSRVGQRSG